MRSLNISTKNDITIQKILAICNTKSDFIFLSDLRLNSSRQSSAIHDVEKHLFFNGYKFYHNSIIPSRGVGILIKKTLCDGGLEILESLKDNECNSLIMKIRINDKILTLASIYGPNHDTELEFFDILLANLKNTRNPMIIGGDWNATFDISHIGNNLDVTNMRNIPSLRRSNKILQICNELSLIEPFRAQHPFKKEYTFIPSSLNDQNRSRIDFFLISTIIFNNKTRSYIPHSLTSTYFDHKPVTLHLDEFKKTKKDVIKDTILKEIDLPCYVRSAVYECYLHHWVPGVNGDGTVTSPETVNGHLLTIGRVHQLLLEIKNIEIQVAEHGGGNLNELLVAGKRAEINLLFEDMPPLEFFENLSLQPDPSCFFVTLVNCIKNNVLSHQSTIFKIRHLKQNTLKKCISFLKENFDENTAQILAKERELSNLVESGLRDELLHYKKFETLNNERVTPYFMKLVKTKNVSDSIENLKKEDGSAFIDTNDLKQHVFDYYSSIYKQDNNTAKFTSLDDINNFLGPVANHEIVLNAKLTNLERDELESGITRAELNQSINGANFSSAPGADGISNRFIKHFWEFFANPLLKLSNHCHVTGTMPMTFRTANIKLIPKKGDKSKIKNWRPISLLNCFYKIVSRVITNRLRKYMDKMTPICQKGYSSKRYCQEVLINIIENIERCNTLKKKAGLISLDIKKAFDSLSHSYMLNVYKFYNFGPNLIRWITTLCTNRKACVIIDGSSNTDFFDLERGNAQGDTISPFLFNLGYQLLLFKLELSLQIKGILEEVVINDNEFLRQHGHIQQVRVPDPKAFALADDCSLLLQLDSQNLENVIDVLRNFYNISGLECNLEKTALMVIGTNEPVPQDIVILGFEITNEITLLGAKLKNTGICFEGNIECILEKVRAQANYWKRFNLSLPGRINIAKTFLYSQINYLGCFLPLKMGEVAAISREVENFVLGKLRIAKNKIYQPKSMGGLELIEIEKYLGSQCCSWIRRAMDLDDLWKVNLFVKSCGNIFNVRKQNMDKRQHPILYNIVSFFEEFIFKFTATNENFRVAKIFENPCLKFENNRQHHLKKSFFTDEEWNNSEYEIKKLSMDMLIKQDNRLCEKIEFENLAGFVLSELKFTKLRGIASTALRNLTKNQNPQKIDSVQNFCMRSKRGSKRYRMVLESSVHLGISPNISKFAELTDTIINEDYSKILNSSWGFSYLTNNFRTFIYKLHNNILGLNSRVAHFVRGNPRTCTFCDLIEEPEEHSETTLHLFFECPQVEEKIQRFYIWLLDPHNIGAISRTEYFVGFNMECERKNRTLLLVNLLVKKYLWDCKLRFTLPVLNDLQKSVLDGISDIAKISNKMRDTFLRSALFDHLDEIHF